MSQSTTGGFLATGILILALCGIGCEDTGEADQLFRVMDATRLADGRIVIANSGSNELRVFNADGSHAGTWGDRGEGPGE